MQPCDTPPVVAAYVVKSSQVSVTVGTPSSTGMNLVTDECKDKTVVNSPTVADVVVTTKGLPEPIKVEIENLAEYKPNLREWPASPYAGQE